MELLRHTDPELYALFNSASFDPARCAHIAVDVQNMYCTNQTNRNRVIVAAEPYKKACLRIRDDAAPAFRRAAIKNYWIWFGDDHPDFYIVRPEKEDITVRKHTLSALHKKDINQYLSLSESPLVELLKKDSIDTLFVSGFSSGACVFSTIQDAIKDGFNVVYMVDCTDRLDYSDRNFNTPDWWLSETYGNETITEEFRNNLLRMGVILSLSHDVVEGLDFITQKCRRAEFVPT